MSPVGKGSILCIHAYTHTHTWTWKREESVPRGRGQRKVNVSDPGERWQEGPNHPLGRPQAQLTALADILAGCLLGKRRK